MADPRGSALVPLRKLLESHSASEMTDGQLLARFTAQRDETAFAVLVKRHGPLVYGVCRHVLGDEHDAEDAFQGTFMVLARKARSIRRQNSVAGWLHGVAYRLSLKARRSAARRRRREAPAARPVAAPAPAPESWRELQAILDEELARLPDKYRAPFVLCVLESKTKPEAARQLHWHEGTVSSRLARAREMLRARLGRRGIELSAVLCGVALTEETARASVAAALSTSTWEAATAFAAGRGGPAPSAAVALAESWLRSAALARLKWGLALFALLLIVGSTAAGLLWRERPAGAPPAPAFDPRGGTTEIAAIDPEGDGLRQLVVRGRVVGSDGQAVPGAQVAIIAGVSHTPGERDLRVLNRTEVVGTVEADNQGRFRLAVPRLAPDRQRAPYCVARGPNGAPTWFALSHLGADQPIDLHLNPGQQVRGRLVDARGAPAAGVRIWLRGWSRSGPQATSFWIYNNLSTAAWPAPVVTDADGRFLVSDLEPQCTVSFEVLDERFAPQSLTVTTGLNRPGESTDAGSLSLQPPRYLQGKVVAADTGEAVAGAHVVAQSAEGGPNGVSTRTDDAGRFSLRPYPGSQVTISACGPVDGPFLGTTSLLQWPSGAASHTVEVRVPRGVIVRGQVVERGSGRPVPGARVEYRPMSGRNPYFFSRPVDITLWRWLDALSDGDGRFQLAVLPGRGHLLIRGPGNDYVGMEVTSGELTQGKVGGMSYFPDATEPLDLDSEAEPKPVAIRLRRGVTVSGRAVRADGKPVAWGAILSRTCRGHEWTSHSEMLPIRNGDFSIPGCDPTGNQPIWFWDPQSGEGAIVNLRGEDTGSDMSVRLAPCGTATVRFVDGNGQVIRGAAATVTLSLRPGQDRNGAATAQARLTFPANFFQRVRVDQDAATGLFTIRDLIPDAAYLLETARPARTSRTISVPAGQQVRLPDIVVNPPPGPQKP